MSAYNESIKKILIEVQTFLNETLKTEKLSEKVKKHKQKISDLINNIQEEYTALKPDNEDQTPTLKVPTEEDESVFTAGSGNSEEDGAYSENIRDIAAANLTNPVYKGYLEKRRKGLMGKFSYQRRYCVIHTAVLYYFEKPTDKKQRGAFHLNGYEFRPAPTLVRDQSKKDLSFELVAPGKRTFEFLAESKDEFNDWQNAVESCHNEPIVEELYEAIEDLQRDKPSILRPDITHEDGEEYEEPILQDKTDDALDEKSDVRKSATPSVPRSPPPPVPPTTFKHRDLPALPNSPLPPIPVKKIPKLDMPDIDPHENYEQMYYGKWNCMADTDNELTFNKGDIIHVISKDFDADNWWVGEFKGNIGLVPKTYLAEAFELVP